MQHLKDSILNKISNNKLSKLILEIIIQNNELTILLELSNEDLKNAEQIKNSIQEIVSSLHKFNEIKFVITNNQSSAKPLIHLENIKKIILVSSGKGGVGKSTMAGAIASQLSNLNYKIGILDADIYGPSIPTIMGISNELITIERNQFLPLVKNNIAIISAELLTKNQDFAFAWRGPMVTKLLYKMLSVTNWPQLDFLIIDMPPGTGDVHLSILENYAISGAIIVTTPQKLASKDVAKLLNLYSKFNIKIYGLINNMCDLPGDASTEIAKSNNLEIIANIKLMPIISKLCDEGEKYYNLFPPLYKSLI